MINLLLPFATLHNDQPLENSVLINSPPLATRLDNLPLRRPPFGLSVCSPPARVAVPARTRFIRTQGSLAPSYETHVYSTANVRSC